MRTNHKAPAASLLLVLITSPYTFGDMTVKVEMQYSLVGAPTGHRKESKNVLVFYIKASAP